jgi:hypothetical protein
MVTHLHTLLRSKLLHPLIHVTLGTRSSVRGLGSTQAIGLENRVGNSVVPGIFDAARP